MWEAYSYHHCCLWPENFIESIDVIMLKVHVVSNKVQGNLIVVTGKLEVYL